MGGCHSHGLASPHLVSGVLRDHVGVNEIVFKQARRKSMLSSKNSLTGRKSSTSHASIEFCRRNVNQLIDLGLRRRSFQTARFLECHFEQGSMSLDDRILPRRFQISHHGKDPPGLAQVLKIGTELCALVHQNFHSITVGPELSQCGKGLGSRHVLPACALVVTCPMTDDVRQYCSHQHTDRECLCPNSCATNDVRQMRMTDKDTPHAQKKC